MTPRYEFYAERLRDAFLEAGVRVDETDLDEIWSDLVDDGSLWALLIGEQEIMPAVRRLADVGPGADPRHGHWHSEALAQLARHENCSDVIGELLSERDDIIACIGDARAYLFNDIHLSEFGGVYVDGEGLLNRLRPSLRMRGRWNPRPDPEVCPSCLVNMGRNVLSSHEDECELDDLVQDLDERRRHLIEAHVLCHAVGVDVIAHTAACLATVEAIAARVHSYSDQLHGESSVDPHAILPTIRLAKLNVRLDEESPTSLMLTTFPYLADLDYCEDVAHTEPHRACRYLIT